MAGPTTLYQTGVHGSRPAASSGCVLYSCTTHSKVYKSDGASWTDWITIPTGASVATDPIFDAAGDLAVGSGADTATKLSIGSTNGMALQRVSGAVAWALPPGYQFDYAQVTSAVSITATSEATANTIVTGNAVTYDGSTTIRIEFFAEYLQQTINENMHVWLYDGSSSIGRMGLFTNPTGNTGRTPVLLPRHLTPTNASHTYSIRAHVGSGTGSVNAGAGGSGNGMPAFIRITKV